jgi:parvulin-like peptidyl-prolyl isomerase
LVQIKAGKSFDEVAAGYSNQPGKVTVGVYEGVDPSTRDLSPVTTDALFKLKPGETSGIINTGYSLQILKNLETGADGKVKAAHIDFNFNDINTYINDLKDREKARQYINP